MLDLGLPDLNGKTVIERMRQVSDMPMIVLSAHDQEMEKIMALDRGANDFVAKPFAIGELLARLRVCLRVNHPVAPATIVQSGGLTIDRDRREVVVKGAALRLTPKEFDLLLALVGAPGRVLTHRQLLRQVWGPAHAENLPYLRVFIRQLRQKLGGPDGPADCIRTEPGIGYRWLPPES
ncbi:winged helix-turn-helix domain-containing protein [Paenirhodobacter populi]|uniref:winged helix-turn-helix domain-containing protein n=1 Tax=Paenirhodobacter populi TaxID=2306993 RepID=UPI00240E847C|nr:response regulator transcription factor [Sinirhodobacter populi]